MKSFTLVPPADPKSHPLRRRWLGTPLYWAMQASGWGLLGASLVFSALYSIPPSKNLKEDIETTCAGLVLGVIITHLIRIAILALRQRRVSRRVFVGTLVPLPLVGAAALINPLLMMGLLRSNTPKEEILQTTPGSYLSTVFLFALLLGVWVCFYLGYLYYHRSRQAMYERLRLDAAVKEAELRALRSQVNPHFLFNSLNCLRALIPRELDRPREAITLLADLLRSSLALGHRHLVPLSQELETADNYLALEQLRFESRLRVVRQIAPEALSRAVPPFVLQTLIENAIKFGVSRFADGSEVVVTARINPADRLELSVENRGRLDGAASGTGVGLRNVRDRLALLFGPSASLVVKQNGERVVALVMIPKVPLSIAR